MRSAVTGREPMLRAAATEAHLAVLAALPGIAPAAHRKRRFPLCRMERSRCPHPSFGHTPAGLDSCPDRSPAPGGADCHVPPGAPRPERFPRRSR
jgi:hypothetical protein